MGRWEPDARGRLMRAAFELFLERGFEQATATEIAKRAGLTERTFYRHFADKPEVLFAGQAVLQERLLGAIAAAPDGAPPLDVVAVAFESAAAMIQDNPDAARQRQAIIAANAELQERELTKLATLGTAIAGALRLRGVTDPAATLAAEAGIAVFKTAFGQWVSDAAAGAAAPGLTGRIRESLSALRAVAAGLPPLPRVAGVPETFRCRQPRGGSHMKIGYKLATEGFGPKELIRQAVAAEQAGFDFVEMSDHYHPWVEAQGHSAFTWSLLPAIAMKTERIGLVTGVTCPSVRYHPAIIAQAAATLAIISDGRFTLGVGAGERLNEHVVGLGFPDRRVRQERFREALEIIRLLWQGGYRSYEGKHLRLEDARVFDLPAELPAIAVAAGGPEAVRIAAELGDGLFATEPDGDLLSSWHEAGGHGPAYGEMPLAWAPDEEAAVQAVLEKNSFALTGWKVMAELPNPVNFEAATAHIGPEAVREQFACGPDPKRHLEVAKQFVDAGFDHLVAMNAGPDPDGFIDFFARELGAPLRALTPSRAG